MLERIADEVLRANRAFCDNNFCNTTYSKANTWCNWIGSPQKPALAANTAALAPAELPVAGIAVGAEIGALEKRASQVHRVQYQMSPFPRPNQSQGCQGLCCQCRPTGNCFAFDSFSPCQSLPRFTYKIICVCQKQPKARRLA